MRHEKKKKEIEPNVICGTGGRTGGRLRSLGDMGGDSEEEEGKLEKRGHVGRGAAM